MNSIAQKVQTWGSVVKFSHTVFALPFALAMLVVASRTTPVTIVQLVWILLALASARTAAMAFNRLVDRHIDAKNPRTQKRELPAGVVSVQSVWTLFALSCALFFAAAAMLGTHCLVLAPLVLALLCFYSWTKRFTRCSHFVLGAALACAPGGAWYAVTARFDGLPLILMVAVLLWVSGFDILYSCQDVDFDRQEKLFSVPAALGIKRALLLARLLHLVSVVLLIWFGAAAGLGVAYYIGLLVFALVLGSQHLIVSPTSLERLDVAFFARNGAASVIFFLGVMLDRLL